MRSFIDKNVIIFSLVLAAVSAFFMSQKSFHQKPQLETKLEKSLLYLSQLQNENNSEEIKQLERSLKETLESLDQVPEKGPRFPLAGFFLPLLFLFVIPLYKFFLFRSLDHNAKKALTEQTVPSPQNPEEEQIAKSVETIEDGQNVAETVYKQAISSLKFDKDIKAKFFYEEDEFSKNYIASLKSSKPIPLNLNKLMLEANKEKRRTLSRDYKIEISQKMNSHDIDFNIHFLPKEM